MDQKCLNIFGETEGLTVINLKQNRILIKHKKL